MDPVRCDLHTPVINPGRVSDNVGWFLTECDPTRGHVHRFNHWPGCERGRLGGVAGRKLPAHNYALVTVAVYCFGALRPLVASPSAVYSTVSVSPNSRSSAPMLASARPMA